MIIYRITNIQDGTVHEGSAEELGAITHVCANTIRTSASHEYPMNKTWNVEKMGDAQELPDHAQRLGLARKCMICGKDFVAKRPETQICSEPCKREAEKIRKKRAAAANMEKPKPEPKKAKRKKALTVWQINAAARAAGMTYGQYVALHKL